MLLLWSPTIYTSIVAIQPKCHYCFWQRIPISNASFYPNEKSIKNRYEGECFLVKQHTLACSFNRKRSPLHMHFTDFANRDDEFEWINSKSKFHNFHIRNSFVKVLVGDKSESYRQDVVGSSCHIVIPFDICKSWKS